MPWPSAGLGCPRPVGSPPRREWFTRFSSNSKAARWAGGRDAPGVQRTVLDTGPGRGGSIPGSPSTCTGAGQAPDATTARSCRWPCTGRKDSTGGAGQAGPMAACHLRDGHQSRPHRSRPQGQRSSALRKTVVSRGLRQTAKSGVWEAFPRGAWSRAQGPRVMGGHHANKDGGTRCRWIQAHSPAEGQTCVRRADRREHSHLCSWVLLLACLVAQGR